MIDFVVHDEGDSVGVVVVEGVKAGEEITGWVMDQNVDIKFKAASDIPIGHKLAIKVRSSPISELANMRMFTTSRPSAGKR
jgi:hypothetical protein